MTATATSARSSRRSSLIVLGSILVVLIAVTIIFRPPTYMRGVEGDPENPDPRGSMAIVEVLRDHGVDVNVVRSVSSALAAGAELLVISKSDDLTSHQLRALEEMSIDTVFVGATRAIPAFLSDVDYAQIDRERPLPPGCDDSRAGAGPISSASPPLTAPGASACFPGPDAGLMLTWQRDTGAQGTIIPRDVLFNEHLLEEANAALAIRVLGEAAEVTWLVGTANDPYGRDESMADFSLTWLWAIIATVFIAAIWWRGPRFGKLVGEPLPVIVNAAETTIGRGHLYRRSGDVGHAATSLRLGALQRIAPRLGLPAHATVQEVIARVSHASGRPEAEVGTLLYGPAPDSSGALHALALSLDALVDEVEQI